MRNKIFNCRERRDQISLKRDFYNFPNNKNIRGNTEWEKRKEELGLKAFRVSE
jgi:hypothetical protein